MLEDVRTRLDVAPAFPCAVPSHGGGDGGPDAGRGGGASEQKHVVGDVRTRGDLIPALSCASSFHGEAGSGAE